MSEDLNSHNNHSRFILTCLIAVTFCGLLSTLFINYQLYQSRHLAQDIGNSVEYSLSTLTPMLNQQMQVIERVEKARNEANVGYVYVRNILKELNNSGIEQETKENLIQKAQQGANKIKSVRLLIDESRRSTDEVGGNFNFMLDQLDSLGRIKDVESSLKVVFLITVITMSLLTLVLLLSTVFIHHSLKRIKAASEQALKARAELLQSQVQQKISELNRLLTGERSIDELAKSFLDFLAPELGAGVAAFYHLENETLCFKQGYAYTSEVNKCYKLGEDIVGQVAVQKTDVELEQVPLGYLDITSGLGTIVPNRLLVTPVIKQPFDEPKGVVEFGLIDSLTGFQRALLKESLGILTISIRSAEYRDNLNRLLNRSEQQTRQLAVAAKEMEQQNHLLHLQKEDAEKARAELEINSRQLIQARDEAEQATRTKSKFLAAMSHEIRTPMNGVLGMLQIIQDTGMSQEQSKYLNVISSSAESLLKIINDILDFSKIEAGKIDLENEPFDLLLLVEEVIEQLFHHAREKGISLLLYFAPHVSRLVKGDPGRIRQILINLLGNGIKFSQQGYVQLSIESLTEKKGKDNIIFKIKDTGIGIDEDKLEMVFDQFTQSDSSTSRKFGGTGLGLSISKNLAESMGGQMTVTSQVGRGSLFQFNILLEKQDNNVSFPPQGLDHFKLLLADSNELRSGMLQTQMASWGMKTCYVSDINNMLASLEKGIDEQHRFDVVLIDEDLMPAADRDYRCSEILPSQLKGCPMIMLQSVHKKALVKSDSSCFSRVLTNPLKMSDLMDVIAEKCDTSTLHHTASSNDKLIPSPVVSSKLEPLLPEQDDVRILLVDDNKVNQIVATVMLKQLGVIADIAENGEEAIAMLKQSPYDLVLMDCQMPVMDGYTATRTIRQSQQPFSDITIIALTANAMEGDKDKCLEAGMNDYLAKPLRKAQLAAKLQLNPKDRLRVKPVVSEQPLIS